MQQKMTFKDMVDALQQYIPGITDEDINSYTPMPNGKGALFCTDLDGCELFRADFRFDDKTDKYKVTYFSNGEIQEVKQSQLQEV